MKHLQPITTVINRSDVFFKLDTRKKKRTQEYVLARQMTMAVLREDMKYTWKWIGEAYGRDHSTVIHAVNNHRDIMDLKHMRMYRDYVDKYWDLKNFLEVDERDTFDAYKLRNAVWLL